MKKIFPFIGKRNQKNSFEELLNPHVDHLYRLAYRFCGNQQDSEDLVQELLIKLYPRTSELKNVEKLKPWLSTSLYRLFIDSVRRNKRSPIHLVDDETVMYETTDNHEKSPACLFEQDIRTDAILSAFNQLNDDQKALITMHDIEGYTLNELQDMLQVPIGTLKSRIHRARARLREILDTPEASHWPLD